MLSRESYQVVVGLYICLERVLSECRRLYADLYPAVFLHSAHHEFAYHAHLFEIRHVAGLDGVDAVARHVVFSDRCVEREVCTDHRFSQGVRTLYVRRRISLCISELLSVFEHLGKVRPLVVHGIEYVVAGAVDYAPDRCDAVRPFCPEQVVQPRYAAAYSGCEPELHPVLFGLAHKFTIAGADEILVRRHYVLA